jgi:AcrR family transcriptional regulator
VARRLSQRDERRSSLLVAAQKVFSEKGYHAATVDDITRAAGVAKGTFYLYFQEKREIYYEVIRGFLQLLKDIGRLAPGRDPDFLTALAGAGRELMRVFLENRELVRLAHRESMGLDPGLEAMVRGFYREAAEVHSQNIHVGMELGLFRPVDPLLTAYAHVGMIERVLLAFLDDEPGLPPPDHIVQQMIEVAFQGLLVRPASK